MLVFVCFLFIVAVFCSAHLKLSQMAVKYAEEVYDSKLGAEVVYESPLKLTKYSLSDGSEYYSYKEGVKTLYEGFVEACRKHENKKYLGQPVNTQNTLDIPQNIRPSGNTDGTHTEKLKGLSTILRLPCTTMMLLKKVTEFGIYFNNRFEWMLLDHACSSMSAVTVPIGKDVLNEDFANICNETEIKIIFTAKNNLKNLTRFLETALSVKKVVVDKVPRWKRKTSKRKFNMRLSIPIFIQMLSMLFNFNTQLQTPYLPFATLSRYDR